MNGLSGGSFEEVQPYYFTVGGSANPNETYWDAIQRLAQEVNWTLFLLDGSRIYYDSQMTLIKQVVAAQLTRDDLEIIDWSYDWETRQIATQFSLTAMCEPFTFHAGDVFKLENFGTASQGSTAKLPGRWLVSNIYPRHVGALQRLHAGPAGQGSEGTTAGGQGRSAPRAVTQRWPTSRR